MADNELDCFLDKTVEIWRKGTRTGDGMGGTTSQPSCKTTVKAMIDPVSGKKRFEYKQLQYNATHVVFFYGDTDIQEGDEIRFGERKFNVLSVIDPAEAGEHKEVEVEEVKINGR